MHVASRWFAMRNDYLSWDDYFMSIANLSSLRSKDPKTKVGACIVNENNHIVGVGYNGFPVGISDEVFPWGREGDFLNTKYPYVVHAEQNAILNSHVCARGARLYVSHFPCHECAKYVIQAGIKEVIYMREGGSDEDSKTASKKMFDATGIICRKMALLEITVRQVKELD